MIALLGGLRPSELTVRGWQALALCVMGVMVLAGAVIGAVLIRHTDQMTRELTDGIHPARVAAGQLQASLRDQETGTRGYLIAADRQFLTPYYYGQHTERAAAE
ncbi:MAG: CHASE3 domain-containing protein, partial [Streptosporangiaceae bacterium]